MSSNMRSRAPGSHRVAGSQALPGPQLPIRFDPAATVENDDREAREVWRAAVGAFGGSDALRAQRLAPPAYLSKINESLSDDERPAQWRWLWTLLADSKAAAVLVPAINARAGYAPPVRTRAVSEEEIRAALAEEVAGLDGLREMLRDRVAQRLGVDPADVAL
jgi:hypothetical protein